MHICRCIYVETYLVISNGERLKGKGKEGEKREERKGRGGKAGLIALPHQPQLSK